MQTNAHSPPPLNMHLWSHKVRYAPEGACRKEIHYFSFCLALLFAAQQLKGSDQPTITVHNGFSASSTSLEACLRLGLSPRAPHLRLQPPPPPLMSVSVRAHMGGLEGAVYVCTGMGIQGHGCDYDSGRPHWKGVESASATRGLWDCLITQQQQGNKLRNGAELEQHAVCGKGTPCTLTIMQPHTMSWLFDLQVIDCVKQAAPVFGWCSAHFKIWQHIVQNF